METKRRITVLVSPEEHAVFTEAAFGARLSLSEWLRGAARLRAGDASHGSAASPARVPVLLRDSGDDLEVVKAPLPPREVPETAPARKESVQPDWKGKK